MAAVVFLFAIFSTDHGRFDSAAQFPQSKQYSATEKECAKQQTIGTLSGNYISRLICRFFLSGIRLLSSEFVHKGGGGGGNGAESNESDAATHAGR